MPRFLKNYFGRRSVQFQILWFGGLTGVGTKPKILYVWPLVRTAITVPSLCKSLEWRATEGLQDLLSLGCNQKRAERDCRGREQREEQGKETDPCLIPVSSQVIASWKWTGQSSSCFPAFPCGILLCTLSDRWPLSLFLNSLHIFSDRKLIPL